MAPSGGRVFQDARREGQCETGSTGLKIQKGKTRIRASFFSPHTYTQMSSVADFYCSPNKPTYYPLQPSQSYESYSTYKTDLRPVSSSTSLVTSQSRSSSLESVCWKEVFILVGVICECLSFFRILIRRRSTDVQMRFLFRFRSFHPSQ